MVRNEYTTSDAGRATEAKSSGLRKHRKGSATGFLMSINRKKECEDLDEIGRAGVGARRSDTPKGGRSLLQIIRVDYASPAEEETVARFSRTFDLLRLEREILVPLAESDQKGTI
jgi:hypothetical protein